MKKRSAHLRLLEWRCLLTITLVLGVISAAIAVNASWGLSSPSSGGQKTPGGMTLGQAVILGIVEGLTEYLPVSSTGHLLLAQRAMGIVSPASGSPREYDHSRDAADAYAICIQAGAIIAVLGLYTRRVKQMVLGMMGKDRAGLRMAMNIAVAFLPAAVIGLFLNGIIKEYLFGPWPVISAWFVGGVAILSLPLRRGPRNPLLQNGHGLDDLRYGAALVIGLAQCIAMWPGVSRSLITIVGGTLVGLSLPAAVEFSFLLGVVTLGAATGYDALKHGHDMLQTFHLAPLSAGLGFAFLSAVLSIKWMVSYLNKHGLAVFGYYRIALAVAVSILMLADIL